MRLVVNYFNWSFNFSLFVDDSKGTTRVEDSSLHFKLEERKGIEITMNSPLMLYFLYKLTFVLSCFLLLDVSQGYTIPLDKRLAADGRGLQTVHINENFAKLAEALYIADRKVL